jgi:hypothetical protein
VSDRSFEHLHRDRLADNTDRFPKQDAAFWVECTVSHGGGDLSVQVQSPRRQPDDESLAEDLYL